MIAAGELTDFSAAIEARFGHAPDPSRHRDLERLLERRMAATHTAAYAEYRRLLERSAAEWQALAPLLTVPETYFFRLPDHFEALAEAVLPALMQANRLTRSLRILSAGCATGEEPYSLRILLNERFSHLSDWQIRIDGVDLSETALERARAGIYTAWSLRSTSVERRLANFLPAGPGGKLFQLRPPARIGVSFERANLLDEPLPGAPAYDLIFCRNVLIYFSDAAAQRVIAGFARRLSVSGYLFLGPAESLRGLSRGFVLCQSHQVFYYRREEGVDLLTAADILGAPNPTSPTAPIQGADTWHQQIRESSERLAALVPEPSPLTPASVHTESRAARVRASANAVAPAPGSRPGPAHAAPAELSGAPGESFFSLLQKARFAEALVWLDTPKLEAIADPLSFERLLRAAILSHLDRNEEAAAECKLILDAETPEAGAHFLYGLCLERGGKPVEAEEYMTQATYLDPGFPLALLHRGLLAQQRNDFITASRALTRALPALDREDPLRLTLFAGHASRESLRQRCLHALRRLGAQ